MFKRLFRTLKKELTKLTQLKKQSLIRGVADHEGNKKQIAEIFEPSIRRGSSLSYVFVRLLSLFMFHYFFNCLAGDRSQSPPCRTLGRMQRRSTRRSISSTTLPDRHRLEGLKFFGTSRPDPDLATHLEPFENKQFYRLERVPIEEADSDIATYLNTCLPDFALRPEARGAVGRVVQLS